MILIPLNDSSLFIIILVIENIPHLYNNWSYLNSIIIYKLHNIIIITIKHY